METINVFDKSKQFTRQFIHEQVYNTIILTFFKYITLRVNESIPSAEFTMLQNLKSLLLL